MRVKLPRPVRVQVLAATWSASMPTGYPANERCRAGSVRFDHRRARRNGSKNPCHPGHADFDWNELNRDMKHAVAVHDAQLLDVRVLSKGLRKQARYCWRPKPSITPPLPTERSRRRQTQHRVVQTHRSRRHGSAGLAVAPKEMPDWLAQRAKRAGLELDRDALGYLANSVEGNLLAAAQEVEKLALAGLLNR